MSVDGGVIVYGVAEDADGRATEVVPLDQPLPDAAERIDQIVQSSVAPTLTVEIHTLEVESTRGVWS